MNIVIRPMKADESSEVRQLGRKSFPFFEGLWIAKPKEAVVAVKEGQIVGAVVCRCFQAGHKKIGYFDFAFVHPDCHNQGIGTGLYHAAAEYLWSLGCDYLSAGVKDDNIGSFGLLLKNGFSRISLPELMKRFGIPGMLSHYFKSLMYIGSGMDYYVACRNQDTFSGKNATGPQILWFLIANLLLVFPWFLPMGSPAPAQVIPAYMLVLAGEILFGYIGTRFTARSWNFRFTNGGIITTMIINFSSIFPMSGNWYPKTYEKTKAFRRDMGITALIKWSFLLMLMLLYQLWPGAQTGPLYSLLKSMAHLSSSLILYHMLPFYPFESFGGGRIYNWNRMIFWSMFLLSGFAVFIL